MKIEILNDEYARVEVEDNKGAKVSKTMSLKTLVNCLRRNEESMESSFMAPGLFKIYETQKYAIYFYLFPARTIPFRHTGHRNPVDIYIPRVVMAFKFSKIPGTSGGNLINTQCFLLDDGDIFNEETPMYHFPFNNYSYSYTPGVCWGEAEREAVNLFKEEFNTFRFEQLYRMFFGSLFNNHLGSNGYLSESLIRRELENSGVENTSSMIDIHYGFYEYLRQINESKTLSFCPSRIMRNAMRYQTTESMINAVVNSI